MITHNPYVSSSKKAYVFLRDGHIPECYIFADSKVEAKKNAEIRFNIKEAIVELVK